MTNGPDGAVDNRYVRVDGKPLFYVPSTLPSCREFKWQWKNFLGRPNIYRFEHISEDWVKRGGAEPHVTRHLELIADSTTRPEVVSLASSLMAPRLSCLANRFAK